MKIRKNLIILTILTVFVLYLPFQAGAVVQWTKRGSNSVLSPAAFGAWDDYSVDMPAVIKDASTYKMWYTGTDDIESNEIPQTGYAYSSDGIEWTRGNSGNPVLSPGSPEEWDDQMAAAVSVIKEGSMYKMWYTGSDDNVGEIDFNLQIGYADSSDGINWTKYSGPVLTKGAASTDWDFDGVAKPTVIIDTDAPASERYKMWYVGFNDTVGIVGIGYAYSSDGINWTKYSDPVILTGPPGAWNAGDVYCPTVIKEDSVYRMWFTGEGNYEGDPEDSAEKIGYYTSIDGINWTQYRGNPVIMQGDTASDDFDENGAFNPMIIKDGTTYKMWYAGEKDCDPCLTQIGYATAPAYSGTHLEINKMRVSTDNRSGGMKTFVMFIPEGSGPLDFNELKVEGPGGFSHTFTDSELWNDQGNQIPMFITSGMPTAGTYTYTAKSNNGLTASNSLNFTSPTTIPVYGTGSGELDMQIKVGGTFYFNQSYIGTTTPAFRFKPAGGTDKYYCVQVFNYGSPKWTVWVSGLILGTDAVGGYIDIAVPANVFVPNAPYIWRVEIFDTSDKWTAHNRSASDIQNFYTGTKDTSATPDFIDWTAFRSQRSFLNGYQTHFGFKVINLAPWDIHVSDGKFSVLNQGGAGTFYNFNPNNNAQTGARAFYYWRGVWGIAADATSTGYEFVATENTNFYFDSANRLYEDVDTLPRITREDMLPYDNTYLENTTPTLSWLSKGTGYKYRVAIFTWSGTEILFSSFQDGLPAGQTMSETIPYGTLRGHNPYSWWVEVFDTNEYSRTRSNRLTFMTGAADAIPVPDIKSNGSDGPVTISTLDPLSVKIELDPGNYPGVQADWWVLANTPVGFYYKNLSFGWQPGLFVTHQGPLFNLTPPLEVLNASGLPIGNYTFYFAVDGNMNGILDGPLFYDSVEVSITP
jgi:sucrose-6-phosphate hydrolase SacC (GH32 family)